MKKVIMVLGAWLLTGCLGMPGSVQPVTGFQLDRYLGQWYEIARLDHSFERGLNRTTAQYSIRDDGGLRVVNRGFNKDNNKWQEAEARGYFVNSDSEAYFKVSFFGPFYGSYVVFDLDPDYQYAFVSGSSTDYLWLLARTPQVAPEVMQRFLQVAQERGFDTDALVYVEH